MTLKCIKECVDDNILPLIADENTTKEASDILERTFCVRGSNQVEDCSVIQRIEGVLQNENEDGSVAMNLQKDEDFGESHLKLDHNVDGMLPK